MEETPIYHCYPYFCYKGNKETVISARCQWLLGKFWDFPQCDAYIEPRYLKSVIEDGIHIVFPHEDCISGREGKLPEEKITKEEMKHNIYGCLAYLILAVIFVIFVVNSKACKCEQSKRLERNNFSGCYQLENIGGKHGRERKRGF